MLASTAGAVTVSFSWGEDEFCEGSGEGCAGGGLLILMAIVQLTSKRSIPLLFYRVIGVFFETFCRLRQASGKFVIFRNVLGRRCLPLPLCCVKALIQEVSCLLTFRSFSLL